MTRHVFDHSQLAHVWAQRRSPDDHGRGPNMFFERGTIYSYGRHFPIARFVSVPSEKDTGATFSGNVVLFTSHDYSISTSKHKGHVRRAISNNYRVFHVPFVDAEGNGHGQNVQAYVAKAIASLHRFNNKRVRPENRQAAWDHCQGVLSEARDYAALFDVTDVHVPYIGAEGDAAAVLAEIAAKAKEAAEALEATRAAREVAKAAWFAENAPLWRNHFGIGIDLEYGGWHHFPCMMRIDGDEIVTSWGARFPVQCAVSAWPYLQALKARGKVYHAHSEHVAPGKPHIRLGDFRIDHVAEDGTVIAGCHKLAWSEVALLAEKLGLQAAHAA